MRSGQSRRGRSEGVEWEGENERRLSWRGRSEGVKGEGENERKLCGRGRSRGGGVGGGRVGGVDEDL